MYTVRINGKVLRRNEEIILCGCAFKNKATLYYYTVGEKYQFRCDVCANPEYPGYFPIENYFRSQIRIGAQNDRT